jgi:hypothetical protein
VDTIKNQKQNRFFHNNHGKRRCRIDEEKQAAGHIKFKKENQTTADKAGPDGCDKNKPYQIFELARAVIIINFVQIIKRPPDERKGDKHNPIVGKKVHEAVYVGTCGIRLDIPKRDMSNEFIDKIGNWKCGVKNNHINKLEDVPHKFFFI